MSVVIPAYNAADYLLTALDSVLGQTYPSGKMEVIVVDDGSTDYTADVARDFLADSTMKSCVLSVENGGPSRARNIGWKRTSGHWVQFLDSDDVLRDSKIAEQATKIQDASDETAVFFSDWQRMHQDEVGTVRLGSVATPRLREGRILADLISSDGFIHLGSALFNRRWLEEVDGFEEQNWLIEDVHLLLRIAMAGGRLEHVETNGPIFFYHQRKEGSLASDSEQAFVDGCLRNARMVEHHARTEGALTEELREQLIRVYFQGTRYYASRDRDRFEEVWNRVCRLDPGAVPEAPLHLRLASKLLGYPAAERVAVAYRETKSALKERLQPS